MLTSSRPNFVRNEHSVVALELRFAHHAQVQIQEQGQEQLQVQPPVAVIADPPPDDDDRHLDVFALHEEPAQNRECKIETRSRVRYL